MKEYYINRELNYLEISVNGEIVERKDIDEIIDEWICENEENDNE